MFMDSKEKISARIEAAVLEIKDIDMQVEKCVDLIITMLKIAYLRGRDDVNFGQSNDILFMESELSNDF